MKGQKGFTLLELMITLSILGVLLPAAFAMFITNIRAQTKVLVLQEVKRNGDAALNTIETLIKTQGESMEQLDGTPICNTSGSSYSGDVYFVDENGNRFMFNRDSNSEQIASNSASTVYLTTDNVDVTSFSLTCERESQFAAPLISVSFAIEQGRTTTRAEEQSSLNYQTKIRLRSF